MTITTDAEHAVLASGGDHVRRYLSIAPRPAIFTDQITAIGRDAANDTIIYLDHANSWAGTLNPAVPHLTVDIGTTAGARDVGSVRLRYNNSTNTRMTIAETGDSDVPIQVGHYASVRLEFRPWQIPKRVVVTRDGSGIITAVTEYFDYDVGYSGGANALNPKPNITAGMNVDGSPAHIRRSRWVDGYGTPSEQTYATFTLSGQHSVALNYGATIAGYGWFWTGSATLVDGYSITDEVIQLQLPAGFHYIGLLVQDSFGTTSDYLWFGVWVHNDANPPFTQFAVTSDETGYDNGIGGREMQLEFFGDADDVSESVLAKGALLNYWEEAEFADGAPPESYRAECYGWVFNEEPLLKREDSRYGVKFGSTASWKPLFDANSITLINTGGTPSTYTEMAHMTVDRVLDWSLRAVDTLHHLINVYYTGVTAEVERMTLPLGTAWSHLTESAPKALLALPACDSYGNLWLRTPIWAVPEMARAARPVALALTAADWWDDDGFALPTELPPTVGLVNAAGEYWDSGDRVLYASVAPMLSGGAGVGKLKMPDQFLQLPNPQEMLNILTGLYYAHANNQRKRLTLVLAGNLDVIEPAWGEPITVTWAYDTVRGTVLATVPFIVTGVSIAHSNEPDNRTPPKKITLTLEQVTQAAAGKTAPVIQMEGITPPGETDCEVVADFSYVIGGDGVTVTFTNESSGDLPWLYFWDFGDGTYSFEVSPVHVFAVVGGVTVTLIVLSECFDFDSHSEALTLSAGGTFWIAGRSRSPTSFAPSGNVYALYYDGDWGTGLAQGADFTALDPTASNQVFDGVTDPFSPQNKLIFTQKLVARVNPYTGVALLKGNFFDIFSRAAHSELRAIGYYYFERQRIHISPDRANFILLVVGYAEFAYSTDGGLTWTQSFIFASSTDYRATGQMVVSPHNNPAGIGRIYALFPATLTLYSCDDWAQTWGLLFNGTSLINPAAESGWSASSVCVPHLRDGGSNNIPDSSQLVFLVVRRRVDDANPYLYRSDDAGVNFTLVGALPAPPLSDLIAHPATAQLLYYLGNSAGTPYLYWTDDAGATWTQATTAIFGTKRLAVDAVDPDTLVAWDVNETTPDYTAQVNAVTTDRGETWTSVRPDANDILPVFGLEA